MKLLQLLFYSHYNYQIPLKVTARSALKLSQIALPAMETLALVVNASPASTSLMLMVTPQSSHALPAE
jgi:hypothetical protein